MSKTIMQDWDFNKLKGITMKYLDKVPFAVVSNVLAGDYAPRLEVFGTSLLLLKVLFQLNAYAKKG